MVNPKRLGGTQIPHSVGRELRWHPHWFGVFDVFYESHIHAWNMAWGWLAEERLGSTNLCQAEHGSPITGWFIASINKKFIPLIFMCKCTDIYMDFDGWYFYCIHVPIMFFICTFTPEGVTKWYQSMVQTLQLDGLYHRWNEEQRLNFRTFCHICYKFSSVAY